MDIPEPNPWPVAHYSRAQTPTHTVSHLQKIYIYGWALSLFSSSIVFYYIFVKYRRDTWKHIWYMKQLEENAVLYFIATTSRLKILVKLFFLKCRDLLCSFIIWSVFLLLTTLFNAVRAHWNTVGNKAAYICNTYNNFL